MHTQALLVGKRMNKMEKGRGIQIERQNMWRPQTTHVTCRRAGNRGSSSGIFLTEPNTYIKDYFS